MEACYAQSLVTVPIYETLGMSSLILVWRVRTGGVILVQEGTHQVQAYSNAGYVI